MKTSHFFAFLKRMRFIKRWGLMRNILEENIQEHSLEVAWIAHQLAILHNTYHEGNIDVNKVAVLAMYHEVSEIFTGDLPTPIKYFDKRLRKIYGEIEEQAQKKMLYTLPKEVQSAYEPLLVNPEAQAEWPYVKAADTISAYLKCVCELAAGNDEFKEAHRSIKTKLEQNPLPEVQEFLEIYVPSLSLSVDELNYTIEQEN